MKVGIGHSDNPDSYAAGTQAASMAVNSAGRDGACDMTLLFSTARHDQIILRAAVTAVVGEGVPIVGGGAVGVITNDYFGYAGDQVAAACLWFDGVGCEFIYDGGLKESEVKTGERLGKKFAELGVGPESPVMLFYDALDCEEGVRMLMATWLLAGIERGLGFFPDLTGAGLMGDHSCSPTDQWIGGAIGKHYAMALAFSGDIQIDSVIMHGCRPATGYYTVTKASGQVVQEINGAPALKFIDELIGSAIPPEAYPFFLIFGVNHGERWGDYDEDYYASRLCLGIDRETNGIIMFEPDMVEGTEFQLMFRSLDLDYIKPKIEKAFDNLGGREPVFAIYINCAGRCAGYAGIDTEDAVVVQRAVGGRVPVLGLYTGVEIASMGGRPRGLDWTGVFCLFSQAGEEKEIRIKKAAAEPEWDAKRATAPPKGAPYDALKRITEQNAAKILKLDTDSIIIRHELEQKRRGFNLLAELTVSLRHNGLGESVFLPVAKRINAALNMQRTVVLVRDEGGVYRAQVLQGYTAAERALHIGRGIEPPPEFLDPDEKIIVTGADPDERFGEFKRLIGIPYFVSSPVVLSGKAEAVIITGRVVEAGPYLLRLSASDLETVQAISALMASVMINRRLTVSEERNRLMTGAMPMCCVFWDENGELTDCNDEALGLFGADDKHDLLERFMDYAPEYQPDGSHSKTAMLAAIKKAFVTGGARFEWVHATAGGEPVPTETTLVRVPAGEDYMLAGYLRDLRDQRAAEQKRDEAREIAERYSKARNEFLASVSHEIRTPLNAIQTMARAASELDGADEKRDAISQGTRAVRLLATAIETMLDFSTLDSGRLALETGEFGVRELVTDIAGIARKEAYEKGLYIDVVMSGDVPETVIGDSARLQQALFNIVMNAVKFTETGGVLIEAVAAETRGADVMINFIVRDTGVGIRDEYKKDILKPLFIGDAAYTRKQGGFGMGLPVTNSLAALMGGSLSFESVFGEGSAFTLTIPFPVPEKRHGGEVKAADGLGALAGMRVLAAEDNKINQMIIEELLTSAGMEVTLAENGAAALAELEMKEFDIVLMDIQMPEMDGLDAAARIRADGRFKDLPILAMTANAMPEHIEESLAAGMNGHLSKPIDVDRLYEALLEWRRKGAEV